MLPNTQIKNDLEHLSINLSVSDFFHGQKLFITGTSGFVGKILLEKLLWSCEEIEKVYVLFRSKRGKSVNERLAAIISLPIFDRLRERDASVFKKIIPIEGDVTKPNFNINEQDRQNLEESTTFLHVASSVRFDEPIKDAIIMNVRGTFNALELAKSMKNLKVMAYVSTTFCNMDKTHVEEKVYKSDVHWKDIIKMAENYDEHTLAIFTKKLLGRQPNTYTFTKCLAENIVQDYSKQIPCVIFRPSIVTITIKEPFPSWVDNVNGMIGITAGVLSGILHTVYGDKNTPIDFIPCDYAVNGIIIAAWYRGISEKNDCIVVNGARGDRKGVPFAYAIKRKRECLLSLPFDKMLWYPSFVMTSNRNLYYLLVITTHVIPGLIIDRFLQNKFGNLLLMRLYRRMYVAAEEISFFILNYCGFDTKNYKSIFNMLSVKDKDTFYCDLDNIDLDSTIVHGISGIKKFIMKEDMSETAVMLAKRKIQRMYWLHKGLKAAFSFFLLLFLFKIFSRILSNCVFDF